jgi:hypothetical protein
MELTVLEVSLKISTSKNPVSTDATRRRLIRAGYTPSRYIGVNAMFDLSDEDIEILKSRSVRGHPKADSPLKHNPKDKKKKAPKKP